MIALQDLIFSVEKRYRKFFHVYTLTSTRLLRHFANLIIHADLIMEESDLRMPRKNETLITGLTGSRRAFDN
jgi:hypothetical protein